MSDAWDEAAAEEEKAPNGDSWDAAPDNKYLKSNQKQQNNEENTNLSKRAQKSNDKNYSDSRSHKTVVTNDSWGDNASENQINNYGNQPPSLQDDWNNSPQKLDVKNFPTQAKNQGEKRSEKNYRSVKTKFAQTEAIINSNNLSKFNLKSSEITEIIDGIDKIGALLSTSSLFPFLGNKGRRILTPNHQEDVQINFFSSYNSNNYSDYVLQSMKPILVLDLDETLVNTGSLEPNEEISSSNSVVLVFTDARNSTRLILKIRDYAQKFLEEMSKKYVIVVYSLGKMEYVHRVMELLDPKKEIFFYDKCYFPTEEERLKPGKTLKKISIFRPEESALIIDDMIRIWSKDSIKNVIPSKKYIPLKQKVYPMKFNRFTIEKDTDDLEQSEINIYEEPEFVSEQDSQLLGLIDALSNISDAYFNLKLKYPNDPKIWDIRNILHQQYAKTLYGIKLSLHINTDRIKKCSKRLITRMSAELMVKDEESDYILIEEAEKESSVNKTLLNKMLDMKWLFDCYFMIKKLDTETYKIYKN